MRRAGNRTCVRCGRTTRTILMPQDQNYQSPVRVDTAMILIVDPCRLSMPPDELAQLVREGHATLVTVDMDGTYSAVLDRAAEGLVLDVDPESSYLARPGEAADLLAIL